MQYLSTWDLVLTPVYLLVLHFIAKKQRDKRYPDGHPLQRYYLPGLWVKFGGAIFITLVYQYYYGGGDTFIYFNHSKVINSALGDSVSTWLDLVLRRPLDANPKIYSYAVQMPFYTDASSYTVGAVCAVLGLLCGTTYLPIALLFAYLSFTGIWAMYRTFVNLYPKLHKELAIAFLFIPSTFVWGSAVFKDTVCMFGLGWLTYTTFRLFVNRDFSVRNILLMVISFYLIYKIKIYILLGFLPALSIWLLTTYSSKIASSGLRFLVKTAVIAVACAGFLFFSRLFAQDLKRYSLENIANTASSTRNWITYASGDEGSSYTLGKFNTDIAGMLQKFPEAVVVTLFRPFPWEAQKLIVLLSAIEALIFAYFTILAFVRNGLLTAGKVITKDPNVLFCLIFSLIFAFAVGISSYNFGALSRYKIPCLPFYAAFLVILLNAKHLIQKEGGIERRQLKRRHINVN
ncbi:MAG TPA: hypothetical protein VM843_00870 [Flavisolibacter sp.]|jgi:hypothetical protein|nr:hypothetical protein [Flavisolibacter sp.]